MDPDTDLAALPAEHIPIGRAPQRGAPAQRTPRRTGGETRRAVIACARGLIEQSGLITLNVASVARECGIHETLIYRHFRSRTGLLEETLGEMWDDHAAASREAAEVFLRRLTDPTADGRSLAEHLPAPGGAAEARDRLLLVQIIAASATLPGLRARMAATQRSQDGAIEQALIDALATLPADTRAAIARAVRALLTGMTLGFAISDLDPERAPSDSELHDVWAGLLEPVVTSRPHVSADR